MTTVEDIELLERAAKAAGISYDATMSVPHPVSGAFFGLWLRYAREPSEYDRRHWNPLTDDGDALRLAVKLRLTIDIERDRCSVSVGDHSGRFGVQAWGREGPEAATRRAIVRAAAALT